MTWLKQFLLWAKTVFDGAAMVFIGVDLDQIDKMAPPRVKSASGANKLSESALLGRNRSFGFRVFT